MLNKDKIEEWILPHIPKGKRGKEAENIVGVLQAIFYRLKTGCQWRMLPMKEFSTEVPLKYGTVYYHYRQWCSKGIWQKLWIALLSKHRRHSNLSTIQIDGSHTICKQGGESSGYQGRKKATTSNMVFLCDDNGTPLSCSIPEEGQHHDTYNIECTLKNIIEILTCADISVDGCFLNADAGLDTQSVRTICSSYGIECNIARNKRNGKKQDKEEYFDDELYLHRFVVERMNAWIDSYKALVLRYEKLSSHWRQLHFIAFSIRFINKFLVQ